MRHAALHYEGSDQGKLGCIRDQWRDLPIGWLTGLCNIFILRGLAAFFLWTQQPSATHGHSVSRRSRQLLRQSRWHSHSLLSILWQRLYRAPILRNSQLATSHRGHCWTRVLAGEINHNIFARNPVQIIAPTQFLARTRTHRGSWQGTLNTVA